MIDTVTIYALADPRVPHVPKYIGATSQSLKRRLVANICDRKPTPKRQWIQSLLAEQIKPIIWAVEVVHRSIWESREEHWISIFKPLGLLNVQRGGLAGRRGMKHLPETIQHYRIVRKGIKPCALNKQITTPKLAAANQQRSKSVRCIDTEEVFPSVASAARSVQFNDSHFRLYLRKGWKIKGKAFKYVSAD